jgi:hypothetical protein
MPFYPAQNPKDLVAPELAWLVAEVDHAFAGIWMQVIQSAPASPLTTLGIALHSCSRGLLEKLIVIQLHKICSAPFYRKWSFIIYHIYNSPQLTLSWSNWIQSIHLHTIYLRFVLILSSNLLLFLPCGLCPADFQPKFLFSAHITCVLHALPILLDLIIPIMLGEKYKLWSSLFCSLLYPHITFSCR